MFEPPDDSFRIPFDGSFRVADAGTRPPRNAPDKKKCRRDLKKRVDEISDLQRILYAHDRHAVLLVFQALDAAGKDSTIRAVASGINPAGCQVVNFKQPSAEELDHDFLWRSASRLPERGRIGIFNRSYYEEVLVVRVHPEYLAHQRLPEGFDPERIWRDRFESIRDHEQHLARNGTVILKFWLNVSREEQKRRFLARIDVPEKNWKFSTADVRERGHWDAYMDAYEEALNATSRPWAPWYAIPADDKPFMRLAVAEILRSTLGGMELHYPKVDDAQRAKLQEMRVLLEDQ
jgi:PPK2 family polyphosphate:nucleotide phosphotransferase